MCPAVPMMSGMLGGCPGNHGGCGERSGGCERRARSPARSPRSPCYPDSLLEVDGELGGVEDAAQVEQEAAVVDAAEDGRARGAEARGDALGAHLRVLDRERAARERDGGHGSAPDLALGRDEPDA